MRVKLHEPNSIVLSSGIVITFIIVDLVICTLNKNNHGPFDIMTPMVKLKDKYGRTPVSKIMSLIEVGQER